MPRLDENTQQYLRDAEAGVRRGTSRAWDSFTSFALRDNVLEVAVGLIIAAAFTVLTTSLVTDVLLPIVSLLPFLSRDLSVKFWLLKRGPNYDSSIPSGYNTPAQALDDGAVVLAYGDFLDKLVRFFATALVLWCISMTYQRVSGDTIVKKQVKCKFCRKWVSDRARRCPECTTWLDGREDLGGEGAKAGTSAQMEEEYDED